MSENIESTEVQETQETTEAQVEVAPEWATSLQDTLASLQSVIETQKETIDAQAKALDEATTKMSAMTESFNQQTANLVQRGMGFTHEGSAQGMSDVHATLQPPQYGYTPLADLDFLPDNFREGKTPYQPAYLGG